MRKHSTLSVPEQNEKLPLAKEAIRKWLFARNKTRLPLPDLEQLRADIEIHAAGSRIVVEAFLAKPK
jgi:hypothetical protein